MEQNFCLKALLLATEIVIKNLLKPCASYFYVTKTQCQHLKYQEYEDR